MRIFIKPYPILKYPHDTRILSDPLNDYIEQILFLALKKMNGTWLLSLMHGRHIINPLKAWTLSLLSIDTQTLRL